MITTTLYVDCRVRFSTWVALLWQPIDREWFPIMFAVLHGHLSFGFIVPYIRSGRKKRKKHKSVA